MTVVQLVNLLPYALSMLVSLLIAGYAWQRRQVIGARVYAASAAVQALTTLAFMLEISSDQLATKLFWDDAQWFTLSVNAVVFFVFVIQMIQRTRTDFRGLALLLSIFPAIFLALLLSNPAHHLVRETAEVIPGQPFSALVYPFTTLTYLYGVYLTGLGLVAFIAAAGRAATVKPPYRSQLIIISIGIAMPTLSGLLVLILPAALTDQRDLTPVAVAIGNVITAWGLFRFRLFDLAPIARAIVFENLNDLVVVIDNRGQIIDANPVAAMVIRATYGEKPYLGQPVLEVFAPWREHIAGYLNEPERVEHELNIVDYQGQPSTFLLKLSPIKDRNGEIIGRVALMINITERKQLELQLRKQMVDLEYARTRAEESAELQAQFLASVSHELRTPLNAIINFTQFVGSGLYGDINDKQIDALNKSTSSARHLLSLINDLLDMSKMQAGHSDIALEPGVALGPIMDDVVTTIRTMVMNKPVEVRVEIAPDFPTLTADRRRLRQVLLNLMTNAAKFTDSGFIKLSAVQADGAALLTIHDTGPGIAPEDQEVIFEPFRQLQRDKGRPAGTGLGLPISRKLIEAHGGQLSLESAAGQGSRFIIRLPLHQPQEMS